MRIKKQNRQKLGFFVMRLGMMTLAAAVTMACNAMAADRVDDFEIEITAPAGSESSVQRAAEPVMTQASSRQKTPEELLWDRAEARSSGMDFGNAFASSVLSSVIEYQQAQSGEKVEEAANTNTSALDANKEEPLPDAPADSICQKPELPAVPAVDEPAVPRFSLTENAHTYKVVAGATLAKMVADIRKMTGNDVAEGQILAAVFRENPGAFTANGLVADKVINVPSNSRILLENVSFGQNVMAAANAAKLRSLRLPALSYPWSEEEAHIAAQKQQLEAVMLARKQARDTFVACLDTEKKQREAEAKRLEEQRRLAETPADIGDDSFMIRDEEDSDTAVSYNENGKRVITFKNDGAKTGDFASNGTAGIPAGGTIVAAGNGVSGTSLVLGGRNGSMGLNSRGQVNPAVNSKSNAQTAEELQKSQAEVSRLKDEITELRSRYEAEAKRNAQDMDELKGMMSQLLVNKKSKAKSEDEESSSGAYVLLAAGLGFLVLLGSGGYLWMRLRLNKMRRALFEAEDSENSNCPDLDGDSVNFGDSALDDHTRSEALDKDALMFKSGPDFKDKSGADKDGITKY